jgi:hypothetical protein
MPFKFTAPRELSLIDIAHFSPGALATVRIFDLMAHLSLIAQTELNDPPNI